MKIKVIGTGSDGNCFLLNDSLMIDIGLPYKKIKESVNTKKVTHIMLTHIHQDHFNKTTIRKFYVDNQNVVFVCGVWLEKELLNIGIPKENILTVYANKIYQVNGYKISPVIAYHDVENFGYRIQTRFHKHFHVTDTATLEGITALDYDSATIECNHEEIMALKLIDEARNNEEFTHLKGAMQSHLSVQQTMAFCRENKIKKLIPVHIGNSTKKEVMKMLGES